MEFGAWRYVEEKNRFYCNYTLSTGSRVESRLVTSERETVTERQANILPVSGARFAGSQPFRNNAGTLSTGNLDGSGTARKCHGQTYVGSSHWWSPVRAAGSSRHRIAGNQCRARRAATKTSRRARVSTRPRRPADARLHSAPAVHMTRARALSQRRRVTIDGPRVRDFGSCQRAAVLRRLLRDDVRLRLRDATRLRAYIGRRVTRSILSLYESYSALSAIEASRTCARFHIGTSEREENAIRRFFL